MVSSARKREGETWAEALSGEFTHAPGFYILCDGAAEYNDRYDRRRAPQKCRFGLLWPDPDACLARFRAFRYRAATRVDTLGGNAEEGREFAAFDIFGTRCGGA